MNSNTLWTVQANAEQYHPNKARFEGILTYVDVPSCKPPSGSRGHNVILTKVAAETAMNSLIGMALGYKSGSWDSHDARNKVGIITDAWFDANKLMISGFIFAKDFPDVITKLRDTKGNPMGLSYELDSAHVTDMNKKVWELNRCTFTGAAILYRSKAAYSRTSFELVKSEKGKRAA